jgi:(1->4)-alpha-D-glucan 1-alpha-D-glucosylmutase
MQKAMREAKIFTSWLNPSEPHEDAMKRFVEAVLDPENTAFREDFLAFERRIADLGVYNSLSQLVVKIAAPGVPDFYQGTELWDFSLVDPDNRRAVNYDRRQTMLAELDEGLREDRLTLATGLLRTIRDDRLKLYTTTTMLRFRRDCKTLFQSGSYEPLAFEGSRRDHLFGFVRSHDGQQSLVIVPRLLATLLPDEDIPPLGERAWGDTRILLEPLDGSTGTNDARRRLTNVFTGRCVAIQQEEGRTFLRAAQVFEHFPVALLYVPTGHDVPAPGSESGWTPRLLG